MKFKTLFTSLVLSLSLNAQAQFMAVANVSKIHGSALINKEKIKEGAEVAEGMELSIPKKGDYVEVKFQNGHIIRLVGAKVKVATLNPKNTLFNLLSGKIFSAIKPLTQNETFEVKTGRATFTVRGTKFVIEESKKQTYLCVNEGVVNVKTSKATVEVKKDEDVTIAPKRELKATLAAQSMIEKFNSVFKDMGI